MHVGKEAGDGAGLLSFLGGKRKISAGAEDKKESLFGNIFGAIRWTLMLSMLLWWIPLIGQALAGYVGGRVAGTPARGMVATLMAALALIGVMMVISSGLIGGFDFLNTEPGELIVAVGMDFPLLGWLLTGILMFMQGFFSVFGATTSMKINVYIITVAFGLIGGILADRHAKEAAKASSENGGRFMPRSLAAYLKGKKLGYENFDDRLSMEQSKVPEQKIVTVHKTMVRKTTAREEPAALPAGAGAVTETVAVQEAEQRESPFAGLIHRAEKNDPEKERVRHSNSKEDMEYV
jgi:hypothetical protein